MKSESLVIADQQRCGEYVLGPCTHRPSRHESRQHPKPVALPFGGSGRRWGWRLGRSRNKVAVPEGAAGSPPFWGCVRSPGPDGPGGACRCLLEAPWRVRHAVGPSGPAARARPVFSGRVWCWRGGWDSHSGREHLCSRFCLTILFLLIVGSQGRSVDALAPGAEEGRCSLRYASGSWQASFDPRVSEWGNPAGVVPGRPCLNS